MNTLKLKLKNNKSGSLPAIKQHITEISRMGGLSKKVNLSQKQTRNNLNEYQSSYKAKQLIKEFYGGLSETCGSFFEITFFTPTFQSFV
jgi:hypothetical protein